MEGKKMSKEFIKDNEEACKFQDDVSATVYLLELRYNGRLIPCSCNTSAEYQTKYGEGIMNIEIKYNRSKYNNAQIVYEEKKGNAPWKPAGILQNKCKFYLYGKYDYAYLFRNSQLINALNKYKAGEEVKGCSFGEAEKIRQDNVIEKCRYFNISIECLNKYGAQYKGQDLNVLGKELLCLKIPIYKRYPLPNDQYIYLENHKENEVNKLISVRNEVLKCTDIDILLDE